jgi:OmpA-OmpF porin, OOP family
MKALTIIVTVSLTLAISTQDLISQVKDAVDRNIEKSIDKTFDNVGKGFNKLMKRKKKSTPAAKEVQEKPAEVKQKTVKVAPQVIEKNVQQVASEAPKLVWSKFDFVPGDKIIFEDNLAGEENGEFPSRWDLVSGTIENAVFGGENVIMFRGGNPTIVPYLKNPNIDYLPEVFTIEFDLYLPYNSLTLSFYDRNNQNSPSGASYLGISSNSMGLSPARSNLPDGGTINKVWAHIAVAYTNGKMKAYVNETRLINIPHFKFNPSGVTLNAYHANDENPFYIKNFRIAEGGVKYYDRFLQDGKIVSNGIRFDIGKATLRPESMGVLNEIYKMLSEHEDINVSIEGHTDTDGDDELNRKLSEERALTVKKQLESMGISDNRLVSKGLGESKPLGANDTPEGKASNRRVEFIKN